MEIQMPYGRLSLIDCGKGDPTLIFVHGGACSKEQWQPQIEHLSKTHRCIAPDLSGHGESEKRSDSKYDVSSAAEEISAIVNALEVQDCVLIGHSLGAIIALAYVEDCPTDVKGLILIDPTTNMQCASQEETRKFFANLQLEKCDEYLQSSWKEFLVHANARTKKQVMDDLQNTDIETFIERCKSLLDYDPITTLEKLTVPIISIISHLNKQPNSLHALFPSLHVEEYTEVSHWLHMDDPIKFNQRVEEFLERISDI